jgi:hypothetical protein
MAVTSASVLVLVQATVPASAAAAPLTGQSAWTVPVGSIWSLHLWDCAGDPAHAGAAGAALFTAVAKPALALWWSAGRAGLVLFQHAVPPAECSWPASGRSSTDTLPEALAKAFPLSFEDTELLAALLRRDGDSPIRMLALVAEALHLPHRVAGLVGQAPAELVAWAEVAEGAVHTPRLGFWAAIRHLHRETPLLARLDWDRPGQRSLPAVTAVFLGLATAALAVGWGAGQVSGWWVVLGAATTLWPAWRAVTRRRRLGLHRDGAHDPSHR